jgi:hypothetical protein
LRGLATAGRDGLVAQCRSAAVAAAHSPATYQVSAVISNQPDPTWTITEDTRLRPHQPNCIERLFVREGCTRAGAWNSLCESGVLLACPPNAYLFGGGDKTMFEPLLDLVTRDNASQLSGLWRYFGA